MKIFTTSKSFLNWRNERNKNSSVGFIPTMGCLHEGHASLVRRARKENKLVVVSIFVNPTQFGPKEDFSKYPRKPEADLKLLRELKCDAVFIPASAKQIYSDRDETRIQARASLTKMMEGKFRPGHFDGVCQVVMKLFQLVQPTRAYFGEKDYQQLQVIRAMVEDFFLPIRIIGCPTKREKSGLAMSSRNSYFDRDSESAAAELYFQLKNAKSPAAAKRELQRKGFQIDYIEVWKPDLSAPARAIKGRWLAAVRFHGVRLIDNLKR